VENASDDTSVLGVLQLITWGIKSWINQKRNREWLVWEALREEGVEMVTYLLVIISRAAGAV